MLAAIALLCLTSGVVQAQDAPLAAAALPAVPATPGAAAVLMDATGLLTIDEVRERFAEGKGAPVHDRDIMATGGGRVLWYQLQLPAVEAASRMILSVPYPGMDRVDLYRPQASSVDGLSAWSIQRAGDAVPVEHWPIRNLYPAFELTLMPQETAPTFLRIEHSFPTSVNWTFSEPVAFQEQDKQWHLMLGVYAGLVLLMAVLSTLQSVSGRDPVHLTFAAYVVVVALAQLALTGLAGEYLWPAHAWWNDHAPIALTLLSMSMLHLLMRQLVVDREMRGVSVWLLAMIALGVLACVGFLLGRSFVFPVLAPFYLLSLATHFSVAALYALRTPRVGLWVLAAVCCLIASGVFPVLRLLSLMPGSMSTQFGAQLGGAVELPLLLAGLFFRSRERRDNRLRMGSLSRVDPLTGLASHRVLLRRLDHLMQRQNRDPMAGAVMRVRLSNAVEIRQEYGVEVSQTAVVYAGACIAGLAQEGDTVGRHRDGDFVLVLHGHLTREQLTAMGQRLIVQGLASNPELPPQTVLQLKIAVAEAPFRMDHSALLLQTLAGTLEELSRRPGTGLRFMADAANSRSGRPHLTSAR